jgi:hypothetical protein
MGTMLHFRTINQTAEQRGQTNLIWQSRKLRQLVGLPRAADSCLWVGKLRTVLPLKNRVIRDSAVQLGLTHQRGAIGVDWGGRVFCYLRGGGYVRTNTSSAAGEAPERGRLHGCTSACRKATAGRTPPWCGGAKVANRDIKVWHGATEKMVLE